MNETATTVDWLPAVIVLGIGLFLGAVMAGRALAAARRGRKTARVAPVAQVRDLAGKRDALVRQLQELEDTATKRTPGQLAQERYELELEAARAVLALDDSGGAGARPSSAVKKRPAASLEESPEASPRSALRGFLWGLGSATAVLLLGFFAYESAKPREAGGSLTGNLPQREGAADPAASVADPAAAEQIAQLKAAIARNPDDGEAHLALAQLSIDRRDYMTAWNETAKVLERTPGDPRALTVQAVVRLAMGQTAVAVDVLRKAVAADPKLYEARVYLAVAYSRAGQKPAVRKTIAEASRKFPERAAELKGLLAELEKEAPAPGAAQGGPAEDPHAGLATPGSGSPPARANPARANSVPASPAPGGRRVAGIIDLDPALKSASPSGILFVYVRNAHASGGPPIAVKRLPAVFPAAFELGEADSMMGQEFPERILIEARLDADGDPTTRDPTDPRARMDDVKAGRTDLRLLLKRP